MRPSESVKHPTWGVRRQRNFIGLDKAKFEEAEKTMKKLIEAKKVKKKKKKIIFQYFHLLKLKFLVIIQISKKFLKS